MIARDMSLVRKGFTNMLVIYDHCACVEKFLICFCKYVIYLCFSTRLENLTLAVTCQNDSAVTVRVFQGSHQIGPYDDANLSYSGVSGVTYWQSGSNFLDQLFCMSLTWTGPLMVGNASNKILMII